MAAFKSKSPQGRIPRDPRPHPMEQESRLPLHAPASKNFDVNLPAFRLRFRLAARHDRTGEQIRRSLPQGKSKPRSP